MTAEPAPTAIGVTVLGSGSRGNCLVIQAGHGAILVDAGFSAKEIRHRLRTAQIDEALIRAILVSHEHDDHVRGLDVVGRQLGVPVFANRMTVEAVRDRTGLKTSVQVFASGSAFAAGDMSVDPFSIPHDAIDPVGFVVEWQGRRIGIATDLGHVSHLTRNRLRDCDLLVVESNHDIAMLRDSRRPWSVKQRILSRHGHLSNEASMELVREVVCERTRHLVLALASQECNRYELVERTAAECLSQLGRPDIEPQVARQAASLPTLWL